MNTGTTDTNSKIDNIEMTEMPLPALASREVRRRWSEVALTALRRAFVRNLEEGQRESLRIGIFSATTWRPIAPFLEGELLLEGIKPELQFFEYESLEAELAKGGESLDAAVLALDDPDGHGALLDPTEIFTPDVARELLDSYLVRVDRLLERTSLLLVLEPPPPPHLPHPLDRTPGGEPLSIRVTRFHLALLDELSRRRGVGPVDLNSVLSDLGERAARDPRLWELGRIRYSEAGFLALARSLTPPILLRAGRGIKAVVVDLDNTLWGGIAGEVGVDGVALGDGYPGSCYRELQKELKRWKDAGVLLAVASKNNPDDALAVMDHHPEMVLGSQDFDRLEIHWEPKSRSLSRILEAFNIGPENVLFIDDNPRELLEVEAAFPGTVTGIRTLELPADPLGNLEAIRSIPWPVFAAVSGEDRRRGELQAQREERLRAAAASASREDYLQSLGIRLRLTVDQKTDVPRLAQLHSKTNQFNLDPCRLGEREILASMVAPDEHVLGLRYQDRFGDAGIVGSAVMVLAHDHMKVKTFLLSCRVIGLGVELALLHGLGKLLPAGMDRLGLPFRETEKNRPAREFLDSLCGLDRRGAELVLPREAIPPLPSWVQLSCATEVTERTHPDVVHAS